LQHFPLSWLRGRGLRLGLRKVVDSFRLPQAEGLTLSERLRIFRRIAPISWRLYPALPPHWDHQIYVFLDAVLALKPEDVPGVIVEAGCFQGVGTAKISHIAAFTGRRLVAFDSFQGLPPNEEPHERSIQGHSVEGWFREGNYAASLQLVEANVAKFGRPDVVSYVPGWFDETMCEFDSPVAAAYLDVDLASSTRTCLKYLWPLLSPGGVLVSQDGDFPLVIEVFQDDSFWRDELRCARPPMEGLGTSKMVMLRKRV